MSRKSQSDKTMLDKRPSHPVGKHRRSEKQLDLDLAAITRLLVQGKTQSEIAAELNMQKGTVSRDIKAIQQRWQQSTLMDFHSARMIQIAKLDQIEAEAWEAWQKSKEEATAATRSTSDDAGTRTTISKRTQSGDSRYLAVIRDVIELRARLLGLLTATTNTTVNLPGAHQTVVVSADKMKDVFQSINERRKLLEAQIGGEETPATLTVD